MNALVQQAASASMSESGHSRHSRHPGVSGSPQERRKTSCYSSVAAVLAALSGCSATTAITPAGFAITRSICRKSKRPPVASVSAPLNFASQSVAGQIVENRCQQKPNGSTANAIKGYVIKSRRSKPKPIKHASANRSIFVPSLITSDDSDSSAVIEIPRIEPLQSLGLDHNALQHLIGATFGSPSEARDLVGGP